MSTTYAQRQNTAQKKDAPTAASVLDNSSQSESLQRKADLANNAAQRAEAPRPNNTGMPDNLKSGIESLSGFSMDDVRVHYNSSKPATVQALAYTQGTDIHVAPGQEKCLPHEAWHVAQQMAGRVSPTTNINGMPVNDNAALEHEADVMGEKAVTQRWISNDIVNKSSCECVCQFWSFNYSESFKEKHLLDDKTYNDIVQNEGEPAKLRNKIKAPNKYNRTYNSKTCYSLLEDATSNIRDDQNEVEVNTVSLKYESGKESEYKGVRSKFVHFHWNYKQNTPYYYHLQDD